jgi:hypothetical protein
MVSRHGQEGLSSMELSAIGIWEETLAAGDLLD